MWNRFAERATEPEILDDFNVSGDALYQNLDQLARINRWLGGNRLVVQGLETILASPAYTGEAGRVRIVDIGCGGGDGLRTLVRWGKKRSLSVYGTGIDANAAVVAYAQKHSAAYRQIDYRCQNTLDPGCDLTGYDIALMGLFLHHFTLQQQGKLIRKCIDAGMKAILINDLHRHPLAYYLFLLVCMGFRASTITRSDGLLSIRKGFRKPDLAALMEQCGLTRYQVKWKWAFRYQLISLL